VAGRERKRGWCQTRLGWFGAKPARSETPVRAAAERMGRGRSGVQGAQQPEDFAAWILVVPRLNGLRVEALILTICRHGRRLAKHAGTTLF
jgi:hypothetical protein